MINFSDTLGLGKLQKITVKAALSIIATSLSGVLFQSPAEASQIEVDNNQNSPIFIAIASFSDTGSNFSYHGWYVTGWQTIPAGHNVVLNRSYISVLSDLVCVMAIRRNSEGYLVDIIAQEYPSRASDYSFPTDTSSAFSYTSSSGSSDNPQRYYNELLSSYSSSRRLDSVCFRYDRRNNSNRRITF